MTADISQQPLFIWLLATTMVCIQWLAVNVKLIHITATKQNEFYACSELQNASFV